MGASGSSSGSRESHPQNLLASDFIQRIVDEHISLACPTEVRPLSRHAADGTPAGAHGNRSSRETVWVYTGSGSAVPPSIGTAGRRYSRSTPLARNRRSPRGIVPEEPRDPARGGHGVSQVTTSNGQGAVLIALGDPFHGVEHHDRRVERLRMEHRRRGGAELLLVRRQELHPVEVVGHQPRRIGPRQVSLASRSRQEGRVEAPAASHQWHALEAVSPRPPDEPPARTPGWRHRGRPPWAPPHRALASRGRVRPPGRRANPRPTRCRRPLRTRSGTRWRPPRYPRRRRRSPPGRPRVRRSRTPPPRPLRAGRRKRSGRRTVTGALGR